MKTLVLMRVWYLTLGSIHASSSLEENPFGLDINAGQWVVHVDYLTGLPFMKGKKKNTAHKEFFLEHGLITDQMKM